MKIKIKKIEYIKIYYRILERFIIVNKYNIKVKIFYRQVFKIKKMKKYQKHNSSI